MRCWLLLRLLGPTKNARFCASEVESSSLPVVHPAAELCAHSRRWAVGPAPPPTAIIHGAPLPTTHSLQPEKSCCQVPYFGSGGGRNALSQQRRTDWQEPLRVRPPSWQSAHERKRVLSSYCTINWLARALRSGQRCRVFGAQPRKQPPQEKLSQEPCYSHQAF